MNFQTHFRIGLFDIFIEKGETGNDSGKEEGLLRATFEPALPA